LCGGHDDASGVNTKTLGRIFSAFSVGLALLGGASISRAAPPIIKPVVELGNNTYSITCEANTSFTRRTKELKAQAREEATKFCASRGKQLKVVSTTENKSFYLVGFARATIVFKALDAGDPELTGEQAATGDLYSTLVKLDDLRKKGILTDEEFQAEKKKALSRSK
jgi:hypothetical protein